MKKLISIVMAFVLLVASVPVTSWSAPHETDVLHSPLNPQYGRNGKFLARINPATPEGTAISDAVDLMSIGISPTFPMNGKYYLSADIDLSSIQNWQPIGSQSNPFTGTLDGWGFEIKNLTIATDSSMVGNDLYVGLFGYVSGAEIKNLGLKNTNINITGVYNTTVSDVALNRNVYAGGFFAYSTAADIYNCYSTGMLKADVSVASNVATRSSVAYARAYAYVGGIYGKSDGLVSVNYCYNRSEITSATKATAVADSRITPAGTPTSASADAYAIAYAGGVYALSNGDVRIDNSFNNGNVSTGVSATANAYNDPPYNGYGAGTYRYYSTTDYAGGICGYSAKDIDVNNCYNSGDVDSLQATGGICGYSQNYATIGNCYNTGNISGYYVGGIYGRSNSVANVRNCSNTGSITGTYAGGGIYGYSNSSASNVRKSYNTGSVTARYAGGIYGYSSSSAAVSDCYNNGNITGTYAAGGILGYNSGNPAGSGSVSVVVRECYNIGAVSTTYYYSDAGGICGFNDGNIPSDIMESCYWSTATSMTSSGVATGVDVTTARPDEDMKIQTSYGGFNFFNVWIMDPDQNNGYPYLRPSTSDNGIYYSPFAEDVIVSGWIDGMALESPPPAEINLEVEQMILYTDYTISSFSIDGGKTWRRNRKTFNEKKFPKLLDKGMTLHLSDMDIDKKTKKPQAGATIIMFQKINPRPATPKTNSNYGNQYIAFTPNYELGADTTGIGSNNWMLGTVIDKKFDPYYNSPVDTTEIQIGVAAANKKTVDELGFGKFYVDDLTNMPKGIPVDQYSGKIIKSTYFVRIEAKFSEGQYTPASKARKITTKSTSRAPNYKVRKDGTVRVKEGTYLKINDGVPVLYKEKSVITVGFYDRIEIWNMATPKKPPSEKQIILPVWQKDAATSSSMQ